MRVIIHIFVVTGQIGLMEFFNTVKSNSSDDIRYLDNSYIPLEGELYKMCDVVNDYINDKGYYLHFCDVIRSSYYKPLFSTCCNLILLRGKPVAFILTG